MFFGGMLIPFVELAFAKKGPVPPAIYLCALIALTLWRYRVMLEQKSDIVLTREGFSRYGLKGLWLNVPWANIESAVTRRMSTGRGIGATLYKVHLKADPLTQGRKRATVKVFSDMVRRDVFDQEFVNHLRENGIPITAD
jgi:hypothetical protein